MGLCTTCRGSGRIWRKPIGFTRGFRIDCPTCAGVGTVITWADAGCCMRSPAPNPPPAVEKDALDRQRGMTMGEGPLGSPGGTGPAPGARQKRGRR